MDKSAKIEVVPEDLNEEREKDNVRKKMVYDYKAPNEQSIEWDN